MQVDARTGAIDHAGIFINHKGKPEHVRRLPSAWRRLAGPVRRVELLTGACILVSRPLWQELGGFDEGYFNGCEDVDLCLRARRRGPDATPWPCAAVSGTISARPRAGRRGTRPTRTASRCAGGDTLVLLGLRDWCRHTFEAFLREPRDVADTGFTLGLLAYLLRLRRAPPPAAVEGIRESLELEIARWRGMFEDREGGPTQSHRPPRAAFRTSIRPMPRFTDHSGLYFDEFAGDSAWLRDRARVRLPPIEGPKALVLRGEFRRHPEARGIGNRPSPPGGDAERQTGRQDFRKRGGTLGIAGAAARPA